MTRSSISGPAAQQTHLALLSVEDSADDVELMVAELTRGGLVPEVQQVQTAEEMDRALRERSWDTICVDYQLPRFDTFRALELRNEHAPDTPVIVVSGYIGETAAVDLLKAGADDYIPKHNLVRLVPALRRAMRDVEDRRARRLIEEERARLVNELASALSLRDEFLVLASHELRTPLAALRLYVEGARRAAGGTGPVRDRLTNAEAQIDRIARLIDDMLAVSRVRPAEPMRRAEVDVRELVKDLARSFAEAQRIENLVLRLPAEPMWALLDPSQMQDALGRLLANALKYGLGRPVEIALEQLGGSIRISVTDQGIGIASENQARIFQRFGRAESTLNYGGLGLGLWIARGIVEAHGGGLTVASQPGQGSVFSVSIPLGR
jgi:signal transduction histidine kinase